MPYTPDKHGRAEYSAYFQLPTSITQALTAEEGVDDVPLCDQKYASLAYIVNSIPINLSGTSLAVTVTDPNYASQIYVSGDYTWVLKAVPGTQASASAWQAQQVLSLSGNTFVTWADGNDAFDNLGSAYASLSYF